MSMWDKTVKYKRYKLAIMWSGGMDTTIAYFYAVKELKYKPEDIVMIHLDYGHPYNWKEEKAIEMLRPYIKADYLHFKIDLLREDLGNIPTPEKQIIPARNLLLAYIGAFFAKRVWLGALDGEMHKYMTDKNHIFFALTTGLFKYVFDDQELVVESPFTKMSKTDVAKWFVENYGKEFAEEVLAKTVTCYDEKEWACGKCSTCFKRWIAYVNAGLDWRSYWKVEPWKSEEAKNLIQAYKEAEAKGDYSHYSKKRIEETKRALEKVGEEW